MITFRKIIRPQTIQEAYELNQNKNSRIIAGMQWTKMASVNVDTAIDLCDLKLDCIEENEQEFSIGAMTSLRNLEKHEGLNRYTGQMLSKALENIVGIQFRNLATVGGSIWGRYGFSDVLTFFLATDCYVELYGAGIVPLSDFSRMKYDRDVLIRIIVKKTPGEFCYDTMRIQKTDFPVLACGVSCLNGEYRAAIGARPERAILIKDEKGIIGEKFTKENAEAFAQYVMKNTPTGSNIRGSAEYRSHLCRILTLRNLLKIGGTLE